MPGMKFYSIYRSVDLLLPPDETKQRTERNRRARIELRPGREPVNRGERTSTHLRRGVNGWIILRSLPGGEGGEPSLCGGVGGVSSFLAGGEGGGGGEEEGEEGRSLSRLGQPGGEPPPGGRTGTRHPIKQSGTARHGHGLASTSSY